MAPLRPLPATRVSAGTVKTTRRAAGRRRGRPRSAPVGLDEGLGDGQAQAGPAAATVLAEHLEDALAVLAARCPGPRRPRRSRPAAAPRPARRRRRPTRMTLPLGRQPLGVLEQVGQHLAHQHVVDVQQGQVRRARRPDAAGATMPPSSAERLVDQLVEARSAVGRSSSAPASMRVMSSRLVTSRARRSDCSSMSSSSSARSSGAQAGVGLAQARHGRLDGGEGRAQVVRGGAHERAAPAVDLLEQARPQRLLAQLGPVDGQRRLVGEGAEQAPVALRPAARPGARACRRAGGSPPAPPRRAAAGPPRSPSERAWPPPDVSEATSASVRAARPPLAATRSAAPGAAAAGVRDGQHQGRPARREDALDACRRCGCSSSTA